MVVVAQAGRDGNVTSVRNYSLMRDEADVSLTRKPAP
jgi:hypothetical protein